VFLSSPVGAVKWGPWLVDVSKLKILFVLRHSGRLQLTRRARNVTTRRNIHVSNSQDRMRLNAKLMISQIRTVRRPIIAAMFANTISGMSVVMSESSK